MAKLPYASLAPEAYKRLDPHSNCHASDTSGKERSSIGLINCIHNWQAGNGRCNRSRYTILNRTISLAMNPTF
jgi:hypothetical protein